jgi:phosphopantothenoylcysteine synthetase/decarboxylase
MMVLNDISRLDIGFESDFNEIIILTGNEKIKKIGKDKKRIIARYIWDEIVSSKKSN